MATTRRHDKWSRAELNALELLYTSGWSWPAIRAHLAGVSGAIRTTEAVRAKGKKIGITKGRPRGHTPMAITDDLEDLMILGRSTRQMADELGVSQCTVRRHIRQTISPQLRTAWIKGATTRQSRAQIERWAKARIGKSYEIHRH